jgi:DNA-binding beta-propeller fold protein YncE
MKKSFFASMLLVAAAAMVFAGVITAGAAEKKSEGMPKLSGTAYIAGHGGHLAVLNLATGELSRIVITGAGGETEGKIAGLELDPTHKAAGGGTHGAALVGNILYVGLLNGKVIKYDVATEKLEDLGQVGQKFCGAVNGPDNMIYYEDMADGNVYIFDPVKGKAADKIPVGKAVCGIGWDKGNKNAFVSDMVQGSVFVIDWKTKKTVNTIKDVGTFIHQGRTNPSQTEFWVTAANEFKDLQPYSVAKKGKSEVVIIDMAKQKVKDRIDLTDEEAFAHDLAFTPDGKYALVTARTYADDSVMLTIDAKTHKILGETSLCKGCHTAAGIKVTIDQGSPLLCGIAVDWAKK